VPIIIGRPLASLIVPTNFPVCRSNPLIVREFVLFEVNRVLLSGPKSFDAVAKP
jgi:hypothetical protein